MNRLPTVFVSHGAPTLALEPGEAGAMLSRLGRELPTPESILVVSAHWEAPRPAVGASSWPRTIHDFYGFPRELYSLSYAAPGAPALAAGDAEALVNYRQRAPQACRNHPTDEHFLPLLVAMGAGGAGATGARVPGGTSHGVLAMDAFVFSPSSG